MLGLGYSARLGLIVVGMCAIVSWSVSTFWAIGTVVQKSYATFRFKILRTGDLKSTLEASDMISIAWAFWSPVFIWTLFLEFCVPPVTNYSLGSLAIGVLEKFYAPIVAIPALFVILPITLKGLGTTRLTTRVKIDRPPETGE